jgi:hypothetical protein
MAPAGGTRRPVAHPTSTTRAGRTPATLTAIAAEQGIEILGPPGARP